MSETLDLEQLKATPLPPPEYPTPDDTMANMSSIMTEIERKSLYDELNKETLRPNKNNSSAENLRSCHPPAFPARPNPAAKSKRQDVRFVEVIDPNLRQRLDLAKSVSVKSERPHSYDTHTSTDDRFYSSMPYPQNSSKFIQAQIRNLERSEFDPKLAEDIVSSVMAKARKKAANAAVNIPPHATLYEKSKIPVLKQQVSTSIPRAKISVSESWKRSLNNKPDASLFAAPDVNIEKSRDNQIPLKQIMRDAALEELKNCVIEPLNIPLRSYIDDSGLQFEDSFQLF